MLGAQIRGSWASPYFAHLLRNWKVITAYALATGSSAAVVTSLLPRKYVARASLVADVPDNRGLSGTLAQFAGQFGLNVLESSKAPEFYKELMRSRVVLTTLAGTQFSLPESARVASLYTYYHTHADSLTARLTEAMVRRLQKDLDATVDVRTGVIRVTLTAADARLASDMLDSVIAITNRFAVSNLRGRAKARREFIEEQVAQARQYLVIAEDSLRMFYEHNRRTADSPQLQFEEARLRRRVDLRQEIYVTLSRDLEQARIDEVRDTPILNVVDPPVPPTRHDSPKRTALTILGAFLGAVTAIAGLVTQHSRTANQ